MNNYSGGSGNGISCCVCVHEDKERNNNTSTNRHHSNNHRNNNNNNDKFNNNVNIKRVFYCQSCVEDRLSSLRKRRMEVMKRHAAARNSALILCQAGEEKKSSNYESYKVRRWRDAVGALKSENEELAIKHLLPLQCSNEERENQISEIQTRLNQAQSGYHGLEEAIIGNIQEDILQRLKTRKLNLQYRLCCRIWQMHRVTLVSSNNSNNNSKNSNINSSSGYGKIGGLPLPHAGPSLYGALPSNLVSSSLYMLASLTRFMSQALDIPLVHPILFQIVGSSHPPLSFIPNNSNENQNDRLLCSLQQLQSLKLEQDVASTSKGDDLRNHTTSENIHNNKKLSPSHHLPNHHSIHMEKQSTSSSSYLPMKNASELLSTSSSYLVSSAISAMKKTYWKTSTAYNSSSNDYNNKKSSNYHKNGNFDYFNKIKRKRKKINNTPSSIFRVVPSGTCCAILCEKPSNVNQKDNNMEYKLQPPCNNTNKNQGEEFSIALQLLQNNIVAMCIRAGVPIQSLYPAEAMLLNLHALVLYCQKEQQDQHV